MKEFNATNILKEIHQRRLIKKHRRKSTFGRLDRYAFEILSLRDSGASLNDIQDYLRTDKRIVIHISTISRFLSKCKKVQEATLNSMRQEDGSINLGPIA